jgi:hypothetical protein
LQQCGSRLTGVDSQGKEVYLGVGLEIMDELDDVGGQAPDVDRKDDPHPIGLHSDLF